MYRKMGLMFLLAVVTAVIIGTPVSQSTVSAQAVAGPGAAAATGITTTGAANAAQLGAETDAFWTAEKRAAAVSKDIGIANVGFEAAAAAPAASGTPTAAGGMAGSEMLVKAAPGLQPTRTGAPLATPVPLDGPFPGPNNTFAYGPKYVTYPIGTVGKLFFHDPVGGGNFQCTATVTTGTAAVQNVIWTAGHCVANGGHSYFYSNFQFCPSYNAGGVNPTRGCWNWNGGAGTPTVWFNNGDLTRDFAFVQLQSTGTVWATDVGNVTGSVGFAWNWGRDQHWNHFGYPCVAPWDCVHIIQTEAEHRYDVNIGGSGPFVNSWGSVQNEGSSGSAVLLFFSYGGGFINSNVSFYFSAGPNGNEHNIELQGPYYDTFACQVWQLGTGFTGTC